MNYQKEKSGKDKKTSIAYMLYFLNMIEQNLQENIGVFIKNLREKRGLTQGDVAKELETTQSVIARMEAGEQNLSLQQIEKLSEVFGRKILEIKGSVDFIIHGGRKLSGSMRSNTSKNGAIALLCASLLNKGKTTLRDVPKIDEVYKYIEIVRSLGVKVNWLEKVETDGNTENSLEIIPPANLNFETLNKEMLEKTRSFMFIGSLVHHSDKFTFPNSGGCKMGARTISAHKYGLQDLGINIKTKEDEYEISKNLDFSKNNEKTIIMHEQSDTGTINVLLAAALVPAKTIIKFAPPNYQVQDICFFLEKCGCKISGIGTTTIEIEGVKEINKNIEYFIGEDPIESMFFIAAAIMTKSELTITRSPIEFLELELEKLKRMGQKYKLSKMYFGKNEKVKLVDITITPSKLKAVSDKIHAQPFPGINTDNLPFFVPIASQTEGQTLIHDWMWENRAIYFTELNKLGAKITLADQHRVFVNGPTKLKGAQIICPPALRPSAIILIAMLGAEGVSTLRGVQNIARGYEDIANRLNKIGAKIEIVK
jgi:UDP-N-acetylglucosamine 1-carboxyvinyltransferase